MTKIAEIYATNQNKYARQLRCTRIHDLLASHAEAVPNSLAAVDDAVRLTYQQLSDEVDMIARALVA